MSQKKSEYRPTPTITVKPLAILNYHVFLTKSIVRSIIHIQYAYYSTNSKIINLLENFIKEFAGYGYISLNIGRNYRKELMSVIKDQTCQA
jgi:hypothetical protein